MKTNITKTIAVMALGLLSFSALAQNINDQENKTKFSLEIDPATFAFKGYSAHIRIQPKTSKHLLFGVGFYAMDFPSVFVDFNKNNRNKGWDVRLDQGYGIFAEHHFSRVNKRWFVGAQASIQSYKIENDNFEGKAKFSNGLLMSYTGYTLQPFNFNFYIKPWAGVGYSSKISGNNIIADKKYDISPVTLFATLHLGYTF